MSDGHSRYYFEISDVLRPGDPEPLERSEAIVRRILYNQRQNEIIRPTTRRFTEKRSRRESEDP